MAECPDVGDGGVPTIGAFCQESPVIPYLEILLWLLVPSVPPNNTTTPVPMFAKVAEVA